MWFLYIFIKGSRAFFGDEQDIKMVAQKNGMKKVGEEKKEACSCKFIENYDFSCAKLARNSFPQPQSPLYLILHPNSFLFPCLPKTKSIILYINYY